MHFLRQVSMNETNLFRVTSKNTFTSSSDKFNDRETSYKGRRCNLTAHFHKNISKK